MDHERPPLPYTSNIIPRSASVLSQALLSRCFEQIVSCKVFRRIQRTTAGAQQSSPKHLPKPARYCWDLKDFAWVMMCLRRHLMDPFIFLGVESSDYKGSMFHSIEFMKTIEVPQNCWGCESLFSWLAERCAEPRIQSQSQVSSLGFRRLQRFCHSSVAWCQAGAPCSCFFSHSLNILCVTHLCFCLDS